MKKADREQYALYVKDIFYNTELYRNPEKITRNIVLDICNGTQIYDVKRWGMSECEVLHHSHREYPKARLKDLRKVFENEFSSPGESYNFTIKHIAVEGGSSLYIRAEWNYRLWRRTNWHFQIERKS